MTNENNSIIEAMELDNLRRQIYVQMCDYFVKFQEIKYKFSFGVLQNSLEYISSSKSYYESSLLKINGLKSVIDHYSNDEIVKNKTEIDEFKNEIISSTKMDYKPDQLVDKSYGTSKSGYLFKKSEGFIKVWQKRFCVIERGKMFIYHNPKEPPKVSLNLLTSQVKNWVHKSLDNISFWVYVINNTNVELLKQSMLDKNENPTHNEIMPDQQTVSILKDYVKNVAGNNKCADCLCEEPEWFSTNIGVVVCIACSGIHRDLGVQISRIRSLAIDNLKAWELFVCLPASLGNYVINEILDPKSDTHPCLNKDSSMEERRIFIHEKYANKKYIDPIKSETLKEYSFESLLYHDISSISYLFLSGYDFITPSPSDPQQNTFLHILIRNSDEKNLCVIEFIVQNLPTIIHKQDAEGNTPLHIALFNNKYNCVKILIRVSDNLDISNFSNITPMNFIHQSEEQVLCGIRDFINNKRKNKIEIDNDTIFEQREFSGACKSVSLLEKNINTSTELFSNEPINKNISLHAVKTNYLSRVSSNIITEKDLDKKKKNSMLENSSAKISTLKSHPNTLSYDIRPSDSNSEENTQYQQISTKVSFSSVGPSAKTRKSQKFHHKSFSKDMFSFGTKYTAHVMKCPAADEAQFRIGDLIVVTGFSTKSKYLTAFKFNDEAFVGDVYVKNIKILEKFS
ncbi:hypothetical protein HZS_7061 [Henneguya salminicola]|nr:hypothetical protein HZS_7061 [Henneguya salminicola]